MIQPGDRCQNVDDSLENVDRAGERRLTDYTKHWELPAMKRKKALSVLLAFAMVFSSLATLFPASAFAAAPSSSGRGADSAA